MPDPRNETPTTHVGHGDKDYDTSVTYSTSELDFDEYKNSVTSNREIKAKIIEERDDEIEVELEVTDNTNVGIYALGGTTQNYPGGGFKQFSETKVFDKSEIPYFRGDFDNLDVEVSIAETIIPAIKEWSDSVEFRA